MTTPATYKEYAADCLTAMRAAALPEVKALLLAMAQQWNESAERAERRQFSRADAASPPSSAAERDCADGVDFPYGATEHVLKRL